MVLPGFATPKNLMTLCANPGRTTSPTCSAEPSSQGIDVRCGTGVHPSVQHTNSTSVLSASVTTSIPIFATKCRLGSLYASLGMLLCRRTT